MSFERKRILIAEDNKSALINLCLTLKKMGIDIMPADGGDEAVRMLKSRAPDLVLLDVGMPDGKKVLKFIRDAMPEMPVVVMTDEEAVDTLKKYYKEWGCIDCLAKPVDVSELHRVLQEWMYSTVGWRRRHLRASVKLPVSVTHAGATNGLYTETISEGGMYIRKDEPLEVGAEVGLSFMLENREMKTDGQVIYIKELSGYDFNIPPGMAVEFKGLAEDDMRAVSDFVKRTLSGDFLIL